MKRRFALFMAMVMSITAIPVYAGEGMPEAEAWEKAEAGELESVPESGYEYSDTMERWYYSNYPNYKDFMADGVVKVAFVCKEAGDWFTPKSDAMKEKCEEYGYQYTFINAGSDEQQWMDGVQNVINQDYDVAVLCPVNTTLLPQAVEMLQEAGIAYMTTDDPGADANGFYVPHYGLDDYALTHGATVEMAESMKEEGFMDNVNEDYSNFLMVLTDSPNIEALHNRNKGTCDAVLETFPDIPEDRIVWLDCGQSSIDETMEKLSNTIQAYKDSVEYWVVGGGGGTSYVVGGTLFQEAGIDIGDHVRLMDGVSHAVSCEAILQSEGMMKASWGAGLISRPSGTGIIEKVHDLVEDGTPLPAFTGYDLIVVNGENIQEFYDSYIS